MGQYQSISRSNIHIVQILERREKRAKEIFQKIMAKNFAILITDTNHRLKELRKDWPGKYKKATTYDKQNVKKIKRKSWRQSDRKRFITYGWTKNYSSFQLETMQTRRQWMPFSNCWEKKKRIFQSRILQWTKIHFQTKVKILLGK